MIESADGSILVCGSTSINLDGETNHGGQDGFVSKYAADGTRLWTRLIGLNAANVQSYEYANAVTVGADGSVFVSGRTSGTVGAEASNCLLYTSDAADE